MNGSQFPQIDPRIIDQSFSEDRPYQPRTLASDVALLLILGMMFFVFPMMFGGS